MVAFPVFGAETSTCCVDVNVMQCKIERQMTLDLIDWSDNGNDSLYILFPNPLVDVTILVLWHSSSAL